MKAKRRKTVAGWLLSMGGCKEAVRRYRGLTATQAWKKLASGDREQAKDLMNLMDLDHTNSEEGCYCNLKNGKLRKLAFKQYAAWSPR